MANVLNYKYGIFPTAPQRKHLTRRMRECRLQYNRAVSTRKRLKGSLLCYKTLPVLHEVMGLEKDNTNPNRRTAIEKVGAAYPNIPKDKWSRIYDLKTIFGKAFDIRKRHCDLKVLAAECDALLRAELTEFRAHFRQPESTRPARPPKRPVYFKLLQAASRHAGYEAKIHMDKAFASRLGISHIRFSVSGCSGGTVANFEKACDPSPDQRRIGASGEPNYKRRVDAYGYQVFHNEDILTGNKIKIRGLPTGMDEVEINLHRPLPDGHKLKRVAVMERGGQWQVVMTLEVTDETYQLVPSCPRKAIGLDPGTATALTSAVLDRDTGSIEYGAWDWSPLDEAEDKMEAISQKLSGMQGPDRRTGQRASNRWKKLNARRRRLHATIARRRLDMHHKISRELVNHGLVAIGNWEPPKVVKGRKEFRKGKTKKVEAGPKGIKAKRRGGRARGLATLRSLTTQKGNRAGVAVIASADERYTTQQCSKCKELTGPKQDLSTRKWTCSKCGSEHDRDQNAALNILDLALEASAKMGTQSLEK